MDLTLESHKTVAKVLVMVEAASQMAVTAVLFARPDGEHRNATAAETTSVFETTHLAHYPGLVALRFDPEGCFVSRLKALARLDIFPDPTAGQEHHQLGVVKGQSKH